MAASNASAPDEPLDVEDTLQYVNGRLVAEQTAHEVRFLALSPSVPWREVSSTPSLSVQDYASPTSPDSVFVRIETVLDASPEKVFDTCFRDPAKISQFDVWIRQVTVLETYDWLNAAVMYEYPTTAASQPHRLTLFRTVYLDACTRTSVVASRSIVHESSGFEGHSTGSAGVVYAPGGFVMQPLRDDPAKTRLVLVRHLLNCPASVKSTAQMQCTQTVSAIARNVASFQDSPGDAVRSSVWMMEREAYSAMSHLSAGNGWTALFRKSGVEVLVSRSSWEGRVVVALRGSFTCPAPADRVAAFINREHRAWDVFMTSSRVAEQLDEGTCVLEKNLNAIPLLGCDSPVSILWSARREPDGAHTIMFKSIARPGAKPDPGAPSLTFLPSGAVVAPAGPEKSFVNWAVMLHNPLFAALDEREHQSAANILGTIALGIQSIIMACKKPDASDPAPAFPSMGSYGNPMQMTPDQRKMLFSALESMAQLMLRQTPQMHFDLESTADTSKEQAQPQESARKAAKFSPSVMLYSVSGQQAAEGAARPGGGALDDALRQDDFFHALGTGDISQNAARPFLFMMTPLEMPRKRARNDGPAGQPAITNSAFDALPQAALLLVMSRLPPESLSAFSMTCKKINALARTPDLWTNLYEASFAERNPRPFAAPRDADPQKAFVNSYVTWNNWRLNRTKTQTLGPGHTSSVRCVLFSPAHRLLVSGASDRKVKLWLQSPETQEYSCKSTLSGPNAGVVGLDFDGKHIYVGFRNGAVRVWDCGTLELVWEQQLVMLADGILFLHPRVAIWEESVQLWDQTQATLVATYAGHNRRVTCVKAWGSSLITSSLDKSIRVWDQNSAQCVAVLKGHTAGVNCVEMVDQHTVASGGNDRCVRLWDLRAVDNGALCTLSGHVSPVRCIKYGYRRLATGSDDRSVRVWETGQYQLLQKWEDHTTPVTCVDLDESSLFSGSSDGVIRYTNFSL
eukprot:m51a1_g8387 putative fbox domain wd g-beta repeat-containing protein (968) ;mRNA; r:199803-204876